MIKSHKTNQILVILSFINIQISLHSFAISFLYFWPSIHRSKYNIQNVILATTMEITNNYNNLKIRKKLNIFNKKTSFPKRKELESAKLVRELCSNNNIKRNGDSECEVKRGTTVRQEERREKDRINRGRGTHDIPREPASWSFFTPFTHILLTSICLWC